MNIQIHRESGRIITMNAPQNNPQLVSIDVEPPKEVKENPHLYVWDGARFVLDSVIQEEQKRVSRLAAAKRYLAETDFYITRKLETGAAVPKAISQKRNKARALLADNLPEFEE
ncbi:hypothetical protein [Enterovibrio norvegicus]|uniref:hypothetical protein n=1 Tax=Enterovibrio norvegicus TaxID=188144 RepID=UPI000C820C48|nr:hypothetical protein [Enterovibrio norvegicus]PMH65403.1 hypothetical protein BCU62_13200 [Enterovibrio norvegicus]